MILSRQHAASILWIGNDAHPEFVDTATALGEIARLAKCPTIAAALELDPAENFAVIVVAEALPGEHPTAGYLALRTQRPATPLVRVYGSLCEGERRTNPPPPALRYSWLHAATALVDQWQKLLAGQCPAWGGPHAQSDEERLLAAIPAEPPTPLPHHAVGLQIREPATAAWLDDWLGQRGVRAIRLGDETAGEETADGQSAEGAPPLDAIVWDRPTNEHLQEAEFQRLRAAFPAVPLVVLAGFPRIDDVARLRAAGAVAVLAKPLAPDELDAALLRVGPRA